MRGYCTQTEPLRDMVTGISRETKASWKRQNPTRIPYSCHDQFGTSGTWTRFPGGGSTVRGMGLSTSQFSTFTMTQTATRLPPGSASGARSAIAE